MSEISHRFVAGAGVRLHVAECGQGPLVLLCHGFPESWRSWRRQLTALAEAGFHAVAPDLRGYGESDRPAEAGSYALSDLVADMAAAVEAYGEDSAVIVGNDWGATIAWGAGLARPDRFRAVAALGVPLMGRPAVPPTRLFPNLDEALFYVLYFQPPGVAEAEFERDPAVTLRKLLFSASGAAGPRDGSANTPNPFGMVSRRAGLLSALPDPGSPPDWMSAADFEALVDEYRAGGFRGGLNYYRNLDCNWEAHAQFDGVRLEAPALYLVGERDVGLAIPGMRELIAAMPALAPDLRESLEIPLAGHWLPQEAPDAVTTALLRFLRGL